ncbi:MAG TPA: hypothetical protein VNY52_13775 [Solirubrobacteraceae bacterium]|jgi:hypothetical protein|nr:hypothetical protein [Solirubrobacteraceae bacterium]
MAAKTIVTSHPDVACDVCGRRLLRGEQPDTFLGGGQRRLVCELCTTRATHEGWRRETEVHATRPRSERPQRGRSLLGKLRQLRDPARPVRATRADADPGTGPQPGADTDAPVQEQWTDIDEEWAQNGASWDATELQLDPPHDDVEDTGGAATGDPVRWDASVQRALDVFNAGELPRRVAGVARALGAPCVRVAPVAAATRVAVVVSWELCWYRYEVDLADEARGAWLAAEGMELGELPEEDRVANTAADERGELSQLR